MTHIEFAARVGVCPRTVMMWIDRGKVKAEKVPHPRPDEKRYGYGVYGATESWYTPHQFDYLISDEELERFRKEYEL